MNRPTKGELVKALRLAVKIAAEARFEWDADNDSRVGKLLIALEGGIKGYRRETDRIHAILARVPPA